MNARERTLSVATFAVLGGALLFTQVLEPGWKRWQELDEQEAVLAAAVERDRALGQRLRAIDGEHDALMANLQPEAEVALVPSFIAHVRQLSQSAGFEPSSLRYVSSHGVDLSEGVASPFAEMRFELKALTSLAKLQGFLTRLAASERHVRVVALSLSPRRGERLEANLSLVALAPREALGEEETR